MLSTSTVLTIATSPPTAPLFFDPQAYGNGNVISTGPATLLSFTATSQAISGTLYVMFFDSVTLPSLGSLPLFLPTPIGAGAFVNVALSVAPGAGRLIGVPTKTGLTWGVSTTAGTFTADTSGSILCSVRFIG